MSRYIHLLLSIFCVASIGFAAEVLKKNPVVTVETSMGSFEIELYPDKAPVTVANFLAYVNDKFFDGTVFHRVMKDFMIQGGGFTPDLRQKDTKKPIRNEADNGLKNVTGTVAMARLQQPHTAASEFFINVVDNANLDHKNKTEAGYGYAVFGKVSSGMEVVNKIRDVKTHKAKGVIMGQQVEMEDVPAEVVRINSIRVKKD